MTPTAAWLRTGALAAALLAAACSRDLAIPPASTLTLADAFPSAAPHEQLTVVASGGAQPYRFGFAAGGNASGGAVDPITGVYTAGAEGPAIDLVEVRDASGAARQARISVGPPLLVSPASAFVAPGGLASFIPTGGKAPYLLQVVGGPAPGTVVGTAFQAAPSGGCAGAVSAPATVALRLTDAAGAPPIDLTVTVGRGLDLFPAAGTGAVAPYEQIAFVASGGQPPYQFALREARSAGCAVDGGRGTYVAGSTGNVVDVVQVTDAIGQERCFPVDVGPELAVALSSADPRPGKAMRILASGGRPPYTFGFAAKGNRSRGTIEEVTGAYVPGLNALATDLLQVSDATGGPPVGPIPVAVGPLEVVTGAGSNGCVTGPVNADGTPDVVVAGFQDTLKVVLPPAAGGMPSVAEYPMTLQAAPVALDLDRDGDLDVAYLAGSGLQTLLAQPGGGLVEGPRLPIEVNTGAPAVAAGPGGRLFVTATFDPVCNPGGAVPALVAYDFDPAARAFGAPTCVAPPRGGGYAGLASGDFDGDGVDDVAYGGGTAVSGLFTYRLSSDGYAVERSVPVPAPWRAQRFNAQQVNPWLAVRPAGSAYSDLVVVVIDAPTGGAFNTGLAVLAGGPAGLALKQTRLTVPGGFNIMSVSPLGMGPGGRPQLLAANVTNGRTELLDYTAGAAAPLAPAAVPLPDRSFRVGSVCGADFDGDGVADLFVAPRSGVGASAEILLGEGDGSYARRPRFANALSLSFPGDVDGDGALDFLDPTVGGGVEVLFSSGGELALGPETPVDGQFLSVQVSDWDGDGAPDLMVRSGAAGVSLYRGLPARDGRFAPPQAVAVVDAAGAPAQVAAAFSVAGRMGGGSTGLDLVGLERVGSVFRHVALLFQDATHATLAFPPAASFSVPLAFDADGDGIDDLVDVVTSPIGVQLSLVRPADPRGASWPFRPWAMASARTRWLAAGVVPVPGAVPARARGVFVGDDGFTLVEAPGGVAGAVELAVDPALLSGVVDARVARVDGDAYPDLVVARLAPLDWLVFRGTPDGRFEAAPAPGLAIRPGFSAGFSPAFVPVRGASGQDDLVCNAAPGAAVVLHNDGAGQFR